MAGFSVGTLAAFLRGDTSGFERAMDDAGKSAEDFEGRASGAFDKVAVGAAAVTAALGAIGAASIKLASDVEETNSAMAFAFGEQGAGRVKGWASSTSAAIGRSKKSLEAAATGLQAMLSPMTGGHKAAEQMSTSLAGLAVDLGSFFNSSDEEALAALKSGLTGSSEPLRRFGVVMTEASLSAFMVSKGIKGTTQDLTEQEKVLLRYQFIMEQTAMAQGDAARTSGSFANSWKRLVAGFEDAAVKLGQALLPAATAVIGVFADFSIWLGSLDEGTVRWMATIGGVVGVLAGLVTAVAGGIAIAAPFLAAMKALGITLAVVKSGVLGVVKAMLPLLLKLALVLAAVAGVILIVGAMKKAWDANLFGIQEGVASFSNWIKDVFGRLVNGVGEAWAKFGRFFEKVLQGALVFFLRTASKIIRGWAKLQALIGDDKDAQAAIAKAVDLEVTAQFASTQEGWEAVKEGARETAERFSSAVSDGAGDVKDFLVTAGKDVADTLKTGAKVIGDALGLGGGKDGGGGDAPADPKLPNVLKDVTPDEKPAKGEAPVMRISDPLEVTGRAPQQSVGAAFSAAGAKLAQGVTQGVATLNNTLTGALEGLAQGGPIGALVGAIVGLLMSSEGFGKMLEMLNVALGFLANAVGSLLEPLVPLMGVVGMLMQAIGALVEPFGMLVEMVVGPLIPPLVALSMALKALAPVVKVVATLASVIVGLLMLQFMPILWLLFQAFRGIAWVLLKGMQLFSGAWNAVVTALASFMDEIAAIEMPGGARPFEWMGQWAKTLRKGTINQEELAAAIMEVEQLTWDEAMAKAENAAATMAATEATQDATASLTNVPRGVKINLNRWKAMAEETGKTLAQQAAAGTAPAPAATSGGGGGGGTSGGGSSSGGGGGGSSGGMSEEDKEDLSRGKKWEDSGGLAVGGIVTRPTIAALAEKGKPEAVIPIDRLPEFMGGGTGGGGSVQVTIVSNDPERIWRRLQQLMARDNFRQRGAPITVGSRLLTE